LLARLQADKRVAQSPFDAKAAAPYLQAMTAAKITGRAGGLFFACLAAMALPAPVWAEDVPDVVGPPGLTMPESGPPAITGPVPRSPENQPKAENKQPGADGKAVPEKGATADASPEQRDKLLGELYTRLATAPDEATAAQIAATVEQLWQHSGSATADLLMARATAATEAQRTDLAMKLLSAAIELQPDYAEAWNRRAYLFYLQDDYKRSLGDIRRVLALEPHHFKALEGLANILLTLGEKKAALEAYESLLKVHPNAPGAKKSRDDLKSEVEGQGI
jgi:tetratricopeptide (TPR) repeat protein